jgi:hypothetical protein
VSSNGDGRKHTAQQTETSRTCVRGLSCKNGMQELRSGVVDLVGGWWANLSFDEGRRSCRDVLTSPACVGASGVVSARKGIRTLGWCK